MNLSNKHMLGQEINCKFINLGSMDWSMVRLKLSCTDGSLLLQCLAPNQKGMAIILIATGKENLLI